MRYLKTFLLFEDLDDNSGLSKRALANKLWHQRNPDPVGTIITDIEELRAFGIPNSIIEKMKEWPIICKSPYSKSFYSSDDISWSHKPDGSFRVSDHWNFTTNRSDRVYCKTNEPAKNNTHYSLGKYDASEDKYEILISEPTEGEIEKIKNQRERLKHLQDPETIWKKKQFKQHVLSGDIFTEFELRDGSIIKGRVDKYTGFEVRVKDKNDNVIYTDHTFNPKWIKLFNKIGEIIENPFDI
jgi:hypothetical protein